MMAQPSVIVILPALLALALIVIGVLWLRRMRARRLAQQLQHREAELRRSRESIELAMHAARAGHFDIALQTGEAYWSPRVREMLGVDDPAFRPTAASLIQFIQADD